MREREGSSRSGWWESAQSLAALATGVAAIAALILTSQSIQATRDQLTITERGQVTERFGRAVDQLGSENLDVRLGGLYALEQLMRDVPQQQPTVLEVLSAFIRTHLTPGEQGEVRRLLPSDVKASISVLGRRNRAHDQYASVDLAGVNFTWADLVLVTLSGVNLSRADLSDADLRAADLSDANLRGADLSRADLTCETLDNAGKPRKGLGVWACASLSRADLTGADLKGADLSYVDSKSADLSDANLSGANLSDANLSGAALSGADLSDANLSGADLSDANLSGADLSDANLSGADLSDANLRGADLSGADLSGADLSGADLMCVRADQTTRLPKGVQLPQRSDSC